MPNLTHGSLFSGIGGFDLGFARANIKTIWQVENDPHANKVLEFHWPEKKRYGDIGGIESIEPCDIFTAGFPCQDLSVAGKRAGLAGARSGLFWEIIRIARKVLPRWILIENVLGLLSSNNGRDFGIVQSALGELGYGVAWRVLNSQYFGVPQRRRRVFVIGYLGAVCPGEVLFEPEGLPGDITAGGKAGADVAYAVRANPSRSCDKGDGGINQTLVYEENTRNEMRVRQSPPTVMNYGGKQKPLIAAPVTTRIGGSGSGWPRYDEDKHLVVYEENTRDELRERQSPPMVANYGTKNKPLIAYNIQQNDGGEHRRKDRPEGGLYVNETETALAVGSTDRTVVGTLPARDRGGGGFGTEFECDGGLVVAHALSAEGADASEDVTGRGTP